MRPRKMGLGDPARLRAIALVALGLILRLVIVKLGRLYRSAPGEEAWEVALTFARTGVWGDAYFTGQGPTAHLKPVSPMIAALLYRQFGVDTPGSDLLLSFWAIGSVMGAYTLTFLVFRRGGMSRPATLLGLAVLCLVPIEWRTEFQDFRFGTGRWLRCLRRAISC